MDLFDPGEREYSKCGCKYDETLDHNLIFELSLNMVVSKLPVPTV